MKWEAPFVPNISFKLYEIIVKFKLKQILKSIISKSEKNFYIVLHKIKQDEIL